MAKNDAHHVTLAICSTLPWYDAADITLQELRQSVGAQHTGVHGQLAPVNLGFLLSCPLFSICFEPERS
jgi:hypothetical protein